MGEYFLICVILVIVVCVSAQYSGECMIKCNELRYEVLSLDMCREAKKTLPRPKVGDACSVAMEQGFSDACISLCMGETPVSRLAQSCRAAAAEMPKPTVRRWCEHGYNVAFSKSVKDLTSHFKNSATVNDPIVTNAVEVKVQEIEKKIEEKVLVADQNEEKVPVADKNEEKDASPKVLKQIPVTLDETEFILTIYENSKIEDSVREFCEEKVPDDVDGCAEELLPTVLQRMLE